MPSRRARSAAVPALLALVFLLSGCSGAKGQDSASPAAGSPVGSPSASASAPQSGQSKGVVDPKQADFFRCLEEKGLPMKETGSGIPVVDSDRADPAKVKEAEGACESRRSVPPVTAEQLAEAREFTACMRANGIAGFPDPDPRTARHDTEELDPKSSPEGFAALKKCGGGSKSVTAGQAGG